MITTAGVYDPESIGWEQHSYAEDILKGVHTDISFFARIFAADKEDDLEDHNTWLKRSGSSKYLSSLFPIPYKKIQKNSCC